MAAETQVQVAVDSSIENIELVQIAIEASLDQLTLDETTAHGIGLAVREAVANAIKHGNREDPDKTVEVECRISGTELVVEVCDEGEGFDLSALPDPLSPNNLLKPDGRGIFFMHQFMDEIDYTFRPEGGTMVTLKKRITPATASDRQEEE